MKQIPCNVIRDLMPSYLDNICSDESKELVEKHLSTCHDCQNYMDRMNTTCDDFTWQNEKEVDCLKKIRTTVDLKSLIFMAVIILTSAAFSYYSLRYGNSPAGFFILTPLVLICNYLMFSDLYTNDKVQKRKIPVILGAVQLCSLIYLLVLMRVFVPKCISVIGANGKLPFNLRPNQLGPLLDCHLKALMLINVIIWCLINYLHLKGKKFYMIISCFSITITYASLYFRYFIRRLDTVNELTPMNNKFFLLLAETLLIMGIIGIIHVIRRRKR